MSPHRCRRELGGARGPSPLNASWSGSHRPLPQPIATTTFIQGPAPMFSLVALVASIRLFVAIRDSSNACRGGGNGGLIADVAFSQPVVPRFLSSRKGGTEALALGAFPTALAYRRFGARRSPGGAERAGRWRHPRGPSRGALCRVRSRYRSRWCPTPADFHPELALRGQRSGHRRPCPRQPLRVRPARAQRAYE